MSNIQEGLRRIIKTISFIAWIWILCSVIITIFQLFERNGEPIFPIIIGIAGFAFAQGLAWIIAGFSGLPKDNDGLIRWSTIKSKVFKKQKNSTDIVDLKESDLTLVGIHGWLKFFCFSLILSTLFFIGNFYKDKNDTYNLYPDLIYNNGFTSFMRSYELLSWASAILLSTAVFLLIKYKVRSTVRNVIIILWIASPASILLQIFFMNFYIPEAGISQELIAGIFKGIVYCIIWSLYLLLSRRVKNTYL